jgi:hypothetical protein
LQAESLFCIFKSSFLQNSASSKGNSEPKGNFEPGKNLMAKILTSTQENMFVGSIPLKLCQLTSLQILDLSDNSISGTIPRCLKNFTAIAQKDLENFDLQSYPMKFLVIYISAHEYTTFSQYPYIEHAFMNTKGLNLEYDQFLD